MKDWKARASELGVIMTGCKPPLTANQTARVAELKAKGKLTDKQHIELGGLLDKMLHTPSLSVTTESKMQEYFKEIEFNRSTDLRSKYLDKGIMVEEQAITLVSEVLDLFLVKNRERKSNAYLTGEPDNVQTKVRDIKSSWDLKTFPMFDTELVNKTYWWQVQAYMELFDIDEAEVIYCLVDTPEILIQDELRRVSWQMNYIDTPKDLEDEVRHNMTFADIPKELRVKRFNVPRDRESMAMVEPQVIRCREYLSKLKQQITVKL
jgi:hypothetical protein